MTVREKIEKGFELANYLVLTLLITAQCTVGSNFFVGQFIYFSANVLAVVRCFVLKRPMADKVKDFCMLGITTGLILIKFLGGIRSQKGDLKMDFEFTSIFYVDNADLRQMYLLCKKKNYTPQQALNEVASGWDDVDFYTVGFVEEQIIEEINRRLEQSKGCD